jgi:hypothetical protein
VAVAELDQLQNSIVEEVEATWLLFLPSSKIP